MGRRRNGEREAKESGRCEDEIVCCEEQVEGKKGCCECEGWRFGSIYMEM
jgi:hypothetical protein